jgi:hypothetical protein
MHLDPAKSIIDKCGGADVVARVSGADRSRVYRWTYPVERGGTGGVIPTRRARKLLAWATANSIKLSPSEFLAVPAPAESKRAAA